MTVYVDNAMIPATVGRHRSRWCHLVSDQLDPTELHAFAARIGLQRSWFQATPRFPHRDHYDVTEGKRRAAVAAGAVEIGLCEFSELLGRKRAAARADGGDAPRETAR